MSGDDATRKTNDDATTCKRAAVQLGYWKDPYIEYFMRASERKAPEINRGYYARIKGMQTLLKQFLQITNGQGQVVNLGSGFDTVYWNLRDEGLTCRAFVEVDFQNITAKKTYFIQNRKPLLDKLTEEDDDIKYNKTDLHSKIYHIVGADLRNLDEVAQKLSDCNIDMTVPTLFQAECVLIYMPGAESAQLLQWIAQHFSSAIFVNYEQVNMGDRFGKVMIDNLRSRGCMLPGVEHCQSLESQKQRFIATGWEHANAMNMMSVYKSLPPMDIARLQFPLTLVGLQEELYAHYAITWAIIDRTRIGLGKIGFYPPQQSTSTQQAESSSAS